MAANGVSMTAVIGALQGVFQEVGGRTIEVTNREYQLRGGINSENLPDVVRAGAGVVVAAEGMEDQQE